jgi:hypothetical protein
MTLSWPDYAVIAGYLLAITAFGSWFARFQKTTRDYFLTARTVPWWAICFTIVATETSTLSFIGVPAQAFAGNMTFLQLPLGYIVGRVLVSVLFIPAHFAASSIRRTNCCSGALGRASRTSPRPSSRDAHAGRRRPPVRDGAGDYGGDAGAGYVDDYHHRRRDDRSTTRGGVSAVI